MLSYKPVFQEWSCTLSSRQNCKVYSATRITVATQQTFTFTTSVNTSPQQPSNGVQPTTVRALQAGFTANQILTHRLADNL